jgi:CRISPR/Cas system-associated exonuclease Cas4 (RecB family)
MTFTHVGIDLPKLKREHINGVRYYTINEENKKLVSITSVISNYNKEKFTLWRQKVGDEEADRIVKNSTNRGTDTHTLIENYLLNKDLPKVQQVISNYLFNFAKPDLNRINNIYTLEGALYSLTLGVAGSVDCIAEFDGELSIIDFKTSKTPKPVDWLTGYFVQTMFYAMAFYEMTGIKIKKLVIIMTCENGECVVYEERDLKKYMKLVVKYIDKFVQDMSKTLSD